MTLMQSDGTFRTTATDTLEGPIPHLRVLWCGYAIDAPVKVYKRASPTFNSLPKPRRTKEGAFVYALPLGGEVVP